MTVRDEDRWFVRSVPVAATRCIHSSPYSHSREVLVPLRSDLLGRMVDVRVTAAGKFHMSAEVVGEPAPLPVPLVAARASARSAKASEPACTTTACTAPAKAACDKPGEGGGDSLYSTCLLYTRCMNAIPHLTHAAADAARTSPELPLAAFVLAASLAIAAAVAWRRLRA